MKGFLMSAVVALASLRAIATTTTNGEGDVSSGHRKNDRRPLVPFDASLPQARPVGDEYMRGPKYAGLSAYMVPQSRKGTYKNRQALAQSALKSFQRVQKLKQKYQGTPKEAKLNAVLAQWYQHGDPRVGSMHRALEQMQNVAKQRDGGDTSLDAYEDFMRTKQHPWLQHLKPDYQSMKRPSWSSSLDAGMASTKECLSKFGCWATKAT